VTRKAEMKGEAARKSDADSKRTAEGWRRKRAEAGRKRKRDKRQCASLSIRSLILSLFVSMPKDTQDAHKHLGNEIVLTILRLADEDMLRDSGNAIYLRMKRELDEAW
jgi:hypothetical protein